MPVQFMSKYTKCILSFTMNISPLLFSSIQYFRISILNSEIPPHAFINVQKKGEGREISPKRISMKHGARVFLQCFQS